MNTYSHETIEWVAKRLSESVEATALILLTHDHPKHREAQKILSQDVEERIRHVQSWRSKYQPYSKLLKMVDGLPRITPLPAPDWDVVSYSSREKWAKESNARKKNSDASNAMTTPEVIVIIVPTSVPQGHHQQTQPKHRQNLKNRQKRNRRFPTDTDRQYSPQFLCKRCPAKGSCEHIPQEKKPCQSVEFRWWLSSSL